MREILFRAKSLIGQWVYGYYVHQFGAHEIRSRDGDEWQNESYHINPKTVGQYTGLTDKNGVKIFEGDIIAGRSIGYKAVVVCVVGYGEFEDIDSDDDTLKYLGWYLETQGAKFSILTPLGDNIEYEVIGNIFDNPELLGGEHNTKIY